MPNPSEVYKKRLGQFQEELTSVRQRMQLVGWSRLLVFVLAGAGIYLLWDRPIIPWIIAVVGFALFLWLVKVFQGMLRQRKRLEALVLINEQELAALNLNYEAFDTGEAHIEPDHNYAHDLDLFGPGSIYQWLNRTTTSIGAKQLAQRLLAGPENSGEIKDRQDGVADLRNRVDLRQEFRASGMLAETKEGDADQLVQWVKEPIRVAEGAVYQAAILIAPIYAVICLALMILGFISESLYLVTFVLPLILVGSRLRQSTRAYERVRHMHELITSYGNLLHHIENAAFESERLKFIHRSLGDGKSTAGKSIQELDRILSMLDQRNNVFVAILLNSWMLWDLRYMHALSKWQHKHQDALPGWLEVLAEFEVLNSLATVAYNRPDLQFPVASADGPLLQMESAGHPLLDPAQRIDNDFQIPESGQFSILTGANMAGKSTFLRTVGVNLVLAQAGAPVCAGKMRFRPVQLFTSMRTTDSLQKNESYFFTELKRLKMIVDRLHAGERLFIILDEILKGTNSRDKAEGSKAFVQQLLSLNATGIVATHDLSLCTLEESFPEVIRNQCFEVEMTDDDITFDYCIRPGVCQNLNATFLMRKMGITTENKSDGNS